MTKENMRDREITEWKVKLKDSRLTKEQRLKVYYAIDECHYAFSL